LKFNLAEIGRRFCATRKSGFGPLGDLGRKTRRCPLFFLDRTRLAEFAIKHHMAMVCVLREQVVAGGPILWAVPHGNVCVCCKVSRSHR